MSEINFTFVLTLIRPSNCDIRAFHATIHGFSFAFSGPAVMPLDPRNAKVAWLGNPFDRPKAY